MKQTFLAIANCRSITVITRKVEEAMQTATGTDLSALSSINDQHSLDMMHVIALEAAGQQERANVIRTWLEQRRSQLEANNANFALVDEMAGIA